ncbi:hypothetical protein [Lysinibacillus sp. Bpr_S20]|uniref:hypothetical protein n=1 Tax=Lysinibacillus sp. Bpr_S20 TaxID=2933964 RepID=UPI0020113529|nr:hypothetical protein [Lysinibacillus sp. Bpr_S20]MCL1701590.1 hypothetical protein [Lysinibacillus sp. Bpr_S20]
MDALTKLNNQIQREQVCIDDLMAEIKIHVQKGQINIAIQRDKDLHNSLKQLEKLHEQKRLWITVEVLNRRGVLAKVVKKVVEMA